MAQRIAAGEWLGRRYSIRTLSIHISLPRSMPQSTRLVWVRAVQLFIGSLTCVLIYLLARSLFDRATGLVAGALAALYRPFFYFEAMNRKISSWRFLAVSLSSSADNGAATPLASSLGWRG